jgi:diguanylate cyclase (GGDEF)-like protein
MGVLDLRRAPANGSGRRAVAGRSLRSQWGRAFARLTAVVIFAGAVSVVGIVLLVNSYRGSAVDLDNQASASTTLRSQIISAAIIVASTITPAQQSQEKTSIATITESFAAARLTMHGSVAKTLLSRSQAGWQGLLTAAGPVGAPADLVTRANAVTTQVQPALALLDQAGTANRVYIRADLAHASRLDREALVLVALLELLAIGLAVRLSLHLSRQVLRPIGILRDSANHLANGDFDHRIVVDTEDELGELAVSFNAMADAIAGSQRNLTEEANTDSLSGLANRAGFYARLRLALGTYERRAGAQALLFVDLDDFKDVNDTFGHAAGDELLKEVARRLTDVVRPEDLVARLGGDEFALLLDSMPDAADALALAERVVATLDEPVRVGSIDVHVGASVGLAMRTEKSTIEGWVREADVAMYAAKGRGKNRVESYNAKLDDAAVARQLLKDEVAGAAARGELVLDYQPVVELDTGALVGLEALVRWQHPVRGLLPPSTFINLAEESGAILSIGAWVLERAARDLRSWQRRYALPRLWISVNVSVCQLETPDYANKILKILATAEVEPSTVVIEVTESVLADPDGGSAAALQVLRLTGVRVALDDFGTGYSSIGYLRQLPVDFLKIDRSFVAGTGPDSPGNALLEAIVGMGHHLGLEIIPEGIEQPAELAQLKAIGCRLGQGFLMSRPVGAETIDALLAAPIPFPHLTAGRADIDLAHAAVAS